MAPSHPFPSAIRRALARRTKSRVAGPSGVHAPPAPHDQRTASTYIFGAICPKDGKAAGLILPWCNIEAMTLFLAELSTKVAPGWHALLLLDQASWHVSAHLVVPDNITIVALPAKCPELNPQENVWEFMRDNWLSNQVFTCYADIVDHCA